METATTKKMPKPRLVRDSAFAKRLETACDNHPMVPAYNFGRLTWMVKQFGGHIACWYGLTWSLELYQQFNARLPRPGQKHHSVFIHHLVAMATADEDVLAVLSRKDATQRAVHEEVAVRLKSRINP